MHKNIWRRNCDAVGKSLLLTDSATLDSQGYVEYNNNGLTIKWPTAVSTAHFRTRSAGGTRAAGWIRHAAKRGTLDTKNMNIKYPTYTSSSVTEVATVKKIRVSQP